MPRTSARIDKSPGALLLLPFTHFLDFFEFQQMELVLGSGRGFFGGYKPIKRQHVDCKTKNFFRFGLGRNLLVGSNAFDLAQQIHIS